MENIEEKFKYSTCSHVRNVVPIHVYDNASEFRKEEMYIHRMR